MRKILLLSLLLVACGGGEEENVVFVDQSPEDPVVIEPMEEEPDSLPEADPELEPVSYFEPDPNLISTCDVEEARNVPEDVLDDFFGPHDLYEKYPADQIHYLHLPAWRMPSTLRMGSDTSPRERRLVIEAVGRLNNVLPDGVDIDIGEDLEPLASRAQYNLERGSYETERDRVKGFIHVDFLSIDQDEGFRKGLGLGYADQSFEIFCGGEELCKDIYSGEYNVDRITGLTITAGTAVLLAEKDLAEHYELFDDEYLLRTIVHELLHVLGLGHTDYSYAYGSVMSYDPYVSETVPGVLDCAGLINLYERKRWILPLD